MHLFVRMTIYSLMGFRHAYLYTNDYPFLDFVIHILLRMTIHIIIGCRHAHLCTNDYPFFCFRDAHLCTNDYFVPNFFPIRFYKMGVVSA